MHTSLRFFPALGILVILPAFTGAGDVYFYNGQADAPSALPPTDNASGLVREACGDELDAPSVLAALRRWAAEDRVAALVWLESQKPSPRFALAAAVEGWSAVDAAAAARYLATCREARWKGRVVDALALDAMAERRPRTALALLARFPGSVQEALLRETARAVLVELEATVSADPSEFDALLRPRVAELDVDSATLAEVTISSADFARLVGDARAVVLDARSEAEHREARVPGALHWPAHDFEGAWLRHHAALESDRSRPIIVYCTDGGCGVSGTVWRELRRLGYARTTVYPDGWTGWLKAGAPVEFGSARGADQGDGASW